MISKCYPKKYLQNDNVMITYINIKGDFVMRLKKFKERNNKQIGIIIFTITCVLLVNGVMLYRTFAIFEVKTNQNVIKGTVQDPGDIYFAYYVDEKIKKDMPQKNEGYILDEEKSYCGELGAKDESIKPTLNEEDWSITVKGMKTSRTKCNLYFRKYYKVKVDETEHQVQTSSKELTIETSGNILLCNNGITAKEESNKIHLSNITKDSTCRFYETSTDAINSIDNTKNYILFLTDEETQSTMTITDLQEVTIDLNGHTKNGTISNSGTLYLKSSKENKGIINGTITTNSNSHTEIENLKIISTNHSIIARNNSFVHIKNIEISVSNPTWTPAGIILYSNSNAEVVDSKVYAPFGIILEGNQNSLLVQNSNIETSGSTALQVSSGIANIMVEGLCKISGNGNGYGIWSNANASSTITLNMLDNQIPTITAEQQAAIYLGYGVLNWQYGEAYGKRANSSTQSVTLTRKGTSLTTENQAGTYHTYLNQITTE